MWNIFKNIFSPNSSLAVAVLTLCMSVEIFLFSFELLSLNYKTQPGLSKFNRISSQTEQLHLSRRCCVRQFTTQCVCVACVQKTRTCWWSSPGWREWSSGFPGWDHHRALLCLRPGTKPARSTCCTPCWRWVRNELQYIRSLIEMMLSLLRCWHLKLYYVVFDNRTAVSCF